MSKRGSGYTVEMRKQSQEQYRHKVRRFTFQFSLKDNEVREWFESQPNKGEYLKSLILADKQRQLEQSTEKTAVRGTQDVETCGSLSGCPYSEMVKKPSSRAKACRDKNAQER